MLACFPKVCFRLCDEIKWYRSTAEHGLWYQSTTSVAACPKHARDTGGCSQSSSSVLPALAPQCPVCMWSWAAEETAVPGEQNCLLCWFSSSRGAFGTRHWQDAAVSPLVLSLAFTMHKRFQRMRKLWIPFSCFLNMPLTWSLWRMRSSFPPFIFSPALLKAPCSLLCLCCHAVTATATSQDFPSCFSGFIKDLKYSGSWWSCAKTLAQFNWNSKGSVNSFVIIVRFYYFDFFFYLLGQPPAFAAILTHKMAKINQDVASLKNTSHDRNLQQITLSCGLDWMCPYLPWSLWARDSAGWLKWGCESSSMNPLLMFQWRGGKEDYKWTGVSKAGNILAGVLYLL